MAVEGSVSRQKDDIPERIVEKLKAEKWQVACAESCTGGMVVSALVNVAGVSDVLMESYVTYSNQAKRKILGVSGEALETWGAVSAQVAEQMALGVAKAAGAQAAVAVTGIAGPEGGTLEKPVGLVFIGCYVNGKIYVTENHFHGSRMEIRKQAMEAALLLLLDCLYQ